MLYLECYPDEQIVKSLGVKSRFIVHSSGKSRVIANLEKAINSWGLVDEDPQSKQLYPNLNQYDLIEIKHQVGLLFDRSRNNYIIELCPNLESWIISASKSSLVGVSNSPNQLHREINSQLNKFDVNIKNLLKSNNKPVIHLKSLLDQIPK